MAIIDRKKQRRKLARVFLIWVGVPVFLAVVYYGLLASDQYMSEAQYTIQSSEMQASMGLDSLISTGLLSGAGQDSLAMQAYVLSRDVLARLDRDHAVIAHYQSDAFDWLSRLDEDATFEQAFEHYRDMVDVQHDSQSGVSTLTVKAATAQDAQRFAGAILKYAEEMVNGLSERARIDRMSFATKEVKAGEERLAKARQAIVDMQLHGEEMDPEASASAVMAVRGELEGELAKATAELRELKAFMRDDSHRVVALKQRIASLEAQVESENKKLVDVKPRSLSASIARFEPLVVEKEFAQKAYESALASLELARSEAAQQHRYLAIVSIPSMPDEATHPERLLNVITVLVVSLLTLGVGSLLLAAIREHANI